MNKIKGNLNQYIKTLIEKMSIFNVSFQVSMYQNIYAHVQWNFVLLVCFKWILRN